MKKVEKIVTVEEELNITGITLLSVKEAKALSQEIRNIGCAWWLCSPGCNAHHAAMVRSDGEVFDIGEFTDCEDIAVRPALTIDLNRSNLHVGDKFNFAGFSWVVVSGNIALCDGIIGTYFFRSDCCISNANDYEKSDVKTYVEYWAKQKGILQA